MYAPPKPRWDEWRPEDVSRRKDQMLTPRSEYKQSSSSSTRHHDHRHSDRRDNRRDNRDNKQYSRSPAPASGTHNHISSGSVTTNGSSIDMSKERLLRILAENRLEPSLIESVWVDTWPDVKKHMFDPHSGLPRFVLSPAVWKPVINAYFSWYCVPREQCTRIWSDIVDMLLRLPSNLSGDAEFRAWAYGCLCKFYLEDRRHSSSSSSKAQLPCIFMPSSVQVQAQSGTQTAPAGNASAQYDPVNNWHV